jgi:hypothetical protein
VNEYVVRREDLGCNVDPATTASYSCTTTRSFLAPCAQTRLSADNEDFVDAVPGHFDVDDSGQARATSVLFGSLP